MNVVLAIIVQLVAYLIVLLADPYTGTLVCAVLGAIAFAIWLLSYVVEWVEPSRVTRSYYHYVLSAWVAPWLALVGFVLLNGEIGWL
ncbi:hypothetical protein CLV84_3621 [Neolewinella xylanilytica]|uniref:Uncharacterized protein n=1 Tax=Neolewinella xylanilytica TaxID=1514080 RepID=A0A2S6I6B4_9BACT|nr:hypothetical protein [Neolewinella xylanilytica]PPK86685.1 hypothetical protein CLV84_3621 [Neolewinella xylanilytica]